MKKLYMFPPFTVVDYLGLQVFIVYRNKDNLLSIYSF